MPQRDRLHDAGFTLVELMVVVLIIGVLVSIAIPVFAGAVVQAKVAACFSNQRTIDGAAQMWAAAHAGNAITDVDGELGNAPAANQLLSYVASVPRCPNGPTSFYALTAGSTNCPLGDAPSGHSRYH